MRPVLKYLTGRVLNAGCGDRDITGFLLKNGAQSVENCDAKTSIPGAMICDLRKIPRPDGAYDSIFCNSVLEYVPGIDDAMRELRRLLGPGGVLVVCMP